MRKPTISSSPPALSLFSHSVAFVSFETVLFVLTLFKFIVALRNGWGRTPVLFLLVRDGTWAFILIFGSRRLSIPSGLFTLLSSSRTVTLCVNAGFYLGAGNSAISSIAFPWLLSIEAFAGARLVLNLHALPFDASGDSRGSRTGGGTLSSHIVFMSNPVSSTDPRAASVRWDWGGVQGDSYDSSSRSRSRSGDGDGSGTRITESYEMTLASTSTSNPEARFKRKHHPVQSASTSATNYTGRYSDTCVDVEEGEEEEGVA